MYKALAEFRPIPAFNVTRRGVAGSRLPNSGLPTRFRPCPRSATPGGPPCWSESTRQYGQIVSNVTHVHADTVLLSTITQHDYSARLSCSGSRGIVDTADAVGSEYTSDAVP